MILLPPDLPDRLLAANEVHARPYEPLDIPVRGSYLEIPLVAFAVAMTVRWVRRRVVGIAPPRNAPTPLGD